MLKVWCILWSVLTFCFAYNIASLGTIFAAIAAFASTLWFMTRSLSSLLSITTRHRAVTPAWPWRPITILYNMVNLSIYCCYKLHTCSCKYVAGLLTWTALFVTFLLFIIISITFIVWDISIWTFWGDTLPLPVWNSTPTFFATQCPVLPFTPVWFFC